MKLSLMTFSIMMGAAAGKVNAEVIGETLKENALTSVELMDIEVKFWGKAELKATLKDAGAQCGCIITSLPFFTKPENVLQEAEVAMKLCMEMGAKTLMVVPGQIGKEEKEVCDNLGRQLILDMAVKHFIDIVALAKKYDLEVGFENTPHDYKPLASVEDVRYVLDNVPELGLIFDTGNFRVADTLSDETAIYEMLKDRIIRVHIKDVVVGEFESGERCVDGQLIRSVTTGSGVIKVYELIQLLKRDGYDGILAVEYAMPHSIEKDGIAASVAVYCSYIRAAVDGEPLKAAYADIDGLNLPVSRIFFGTAVMPMLLGEDVSYILDTAVSAGINAFDCARGYGRAEESLGSWIKSRNNRDRIIVLTKCGNVDMKGQVKVNRKVIESELTKSLKALQTDYIDIYLLHRDDPATPIPEIMETLNDAKNAGKIKVFGASNWTHERIAEANKYAAEHGLDGFAVSSPNYGLACQVEDPWGGECVTIAGPENADAREWYAVNQMPVIAYSSLARGFFSGKFKSGDYEGARKLLDKAGQKGYLHETNMQRLTRTEKLAEHNHSAVPQIALQYVFSNDMNVFAIVSSLNPKRLASNVKAALEPLSAEDVKYLEG